ncbi:hypothetical protein MKW92_045432 [Papaver armeniacum]|nr:hypothetical protein MKW92_045432 [Papaver armeniacum]
MTREKRCTYKLEWLNMLRSYGNYSRKTTLSFTCAGLKGMEKGIDDIMVSFYAKDGIDWLEYKRQLKKAEQWNVEVY